MSDSAILPVKLPGIDNVPILGQTDELRERVRKIADIQFTPAAEPAPQFPESFVPHSLGGFRGAFYDMARRMPTEQEIWCAGIRSWRDLTEKNFKDLPDRVTLEHVASLVAKIEFLTLDTTMIQCTILMTNGHVVVGHSRPVAEAQFNQEEGEDRAKKAALDQIFALEAYVLRNKRFEQGLK